MGVFAHLNLISRGTQDFLARYSACLSCFLAPCPLYIKKSAEYMCHYDNVHMMPSKNNTLCIDLKIYVKQLTTPDSYILYYTVKLRLNQDCILHLERKTAFTKPKKNVTMIFLITMLNNASVHISQVIFSSASARSIDIH